MSSPVLSALIPVVLLIAIGYIAGKQGWIRAEASKDLSNLVFVILTPALLFRTMSSVHLEQLDFRPVGIYFVAVGILFLATLLVQGFNRRGAVLALACTFSNTVMIGIALVGLAYGPDALVILLTLVSVHALVLLTAGTVVLELALAHEAKPVQGAQSHMLTTVAKALASAVIHPVPLPIIAGLLFAQTGWLIPEMLDKPLLWLGNAFGPLALLLVGLTLSATQTGAHWRGALALAGAKNIVHPALVTLLAILFGVQGLPLVVMVVAAAMPIGANVFLFSQRYEVAEELVMASVVVSTVMALVTIPVTMFLAGRF